jgi:hypothetical protein
MAILAVLEGGLPACRKATRTASLPTTTLQLPNPIQQTGEAVAHIQASASRKGCHRRKRAHQSRANWRDGL